MRELLFFLMGLTTGGVASFDLAADMRGSYAEGDKWLSTSVTDLDGAQPGDLIPTRVGAGKVLAFLKQWKNGGRPPPA